MRRGRRRRAVQSAQRASVDKTKTCEVTAAIGDRLPDTPCLPEAVVRGVGTEDEEEREGAAEEGVHLGERLGELVAGSRPRGERGERGDERHGETDGDHSKERLGDPAENLALRKVA